MLPTSIARIQSADRVVNQLQQNIIPPLQEVIANPVVCGVIIQNVNLVSGLNTVNHGLGRTLQGWSAVRVRSQCQLWDSQDSNNSPAQTLLLNSNAAVTVDLLVF